MNENTVEISKDEYKSILELAYKAAMLKEVLLNATGIYGNELYFGGSAEVTTIFKYCFPFEYARKLRELKREEDKKEVAGDEH